MKLFIAGEGLDEIGDFVHERAYRPAKCRGGIIEALLRRVVASGWTIVDGCPWRRIRKFAFGRDMHGRERRNILGLVDQAAEAGCEVVAFVRDRDGEKDRHASIELAIAEVRECGFGMAVIGGTAIEATDAWILACLGETRSEDLTDPKITLQDRFSVSTSAGKTEIVESANWDKLPTDASSLRTWLQRATAVLGRLQPNHP